MGRVCYGTRCPVTQIPMAGTYIYKSSFFPQTIRDWNLLTDSLISASECAVDSVTKFTSLVRARD